jgi:L-fuconolactonase
MADLPYSIVDAHTHLWDTGRFELSWLADVPELSSRYEAGDLRSAIATLPVGAAIAVQAGESAGEAAWLLGDDTGASATGALPTRVVLQYAPAPIGWLGAVHDVATAGGLLSAGIRIPLHRRSADWTDLEGLGALLCGLEEHGMVLELLLRPDQITVVPDLAAAHPQLDIVLCHLGLSTGEPTREWRAALATVTGRPNVSAKISGIFSPRGTPRDGDARPRAAVAEAVAALGPDRLLFGSDWPMSTRVGSYAEVVERTMLLLPELTREESAAVWCGTADRIYGPSDSR